MKQAFKYRLYPTISQRKHFESYFNACWWFYRYVLHHYEDDYKYAKNGLLEDLFGSMRKIELGYPYVNFNLDYLKLKIPKEYYRNGAPIRHQGKGNLSTYKLLQKARGNPYNNEKHNLQQIPSVVMQEVLERVAHAFDKFWKEGGGYPKYPKEQNYRSVTWTGIDNIKLYEDDSLVKLSKFPGFLKIEYHRPIKGIIKRANISKDILGQYYISLVCEFDEPPVVVKSGVIGIDMNIKAIDDNTRSFITCSDGKKIDIPRWYSLFEEKLAKIQRKISACEQGSPEWVKYNRILKHDREKIANKSMYWLHNLTALLEKNYEYVVIEDLNLTGFHKKRDDPSTVSNRELAGDRGKRKAWTETPFGEFKRQLSYKLGDRLIKVDPAYTSKTCSSCGYLNEGLTLDQREWVCPECGIHHDRDVNAAINIRNAGLVIINGSIKTKQEPGVAKAWVC